MKCFFSKSRPHYVIVLFCLVILAQSAFAQKFTPPPHPDRAPNISSNYANDKDSNRIDDTLFDKAERALMSERTAVTTDDKNKARAELDKLVDVELIFTGQINQNQIDDFLASGGEITYVYKAVSYGWNGRIPLGKVMHIAARMGKELVLIDEPKAAQLHMRIATQTGRVRPVWANGFAGGTGYNGDNSISIAIIDTGVDDSHTDLAGRNVYWHDYTPDNQSSPRDIIQHGSHVAGIALGSGASLGTGTTLYYTDSGSLSGVPSGSFYPGVIDFPSVATTWNSTATWLGGGTTTLYHVYTAKGSSTWSAQNSTSGSSGLTLNTSFTPLSTRAYSTALIQNQNRKISTYAVANSMTNYSTVGDGFNTLRGVAPGSRWAGAKVFTNSGSGILSWTGAAIDDMVSKRTTYNIKVMNLSLGANGNPGIDTSTRQKINNAANNGILPVISAGNDGPGSGGANEVDDPGRAAMALTVGASNDINQLTEYTSSGFLNPGSTPGQEEDYKPDILAPGGSSYYSFIMSVDSNDADGENASFPDRQSNDYYNISGTSMAAPFAAGAAALLIDALQSTGNLTGGSWNFSSSNDVQLVKMLLSATATETNALREASPGYDPTLQRNSIGPNGFPSGKDRFEGYGMLNVDAAIEGGTVVHLIGSAENATLGGSDTARRAWARKISMTAGLAFTLSLNVPGSGDFDLSLYSLTPGIYGRPVMLASSTNSGAGTSETINYTPVANENAVLIVKKISGSGQFTLTSNLAIYTLNVTKSGAGSGTITSSPSGIDCGADCSQDYSYNTTVTLTASPDAGSAFAGWSGDSDCTDGIVTMDTGKTCTATFNINQYQLITSASPPAGGNLTPDCSGGCVYDNGTIVVLTATENNGYFFDIWTNCDSPSNNVCTETMDADDSVTANFQPCYQPVRIAGTTPVYYPTLQSAYDDAIEGDTIQTRTVTFSDDLNTNRNISITLQGGYNCSYSAVTGNTVFNRTMTISDGVVTIGDYIFGN